MKKHQGYQYIVVLLAIFLLVGCGAPKPSAFSSMSGIAVTATERWAPVQERGAIYSTAIDNGDNLRGVDMALTDGKNHYFTVEYYDCEEAVADLGRLADQLRSQLERLGEQQLVEELVAQGADEATMAQYRLLWECPPGEEAGVYPVLADEAWHREMTALTNDYTAVAVEKVTLLGRETTLYQYEYTNADGEKLCGYEAAVVWGNHFYSFNGWTTEKGFEKGADMLRDMILSVRQADQ